MLNHSTPHVAMIPGEAEFKDVRRQMYRGTRVLAYFLSVDQLNGFCGQLSPFALLHSLPHPFGMALRL